MQSTDRRKIYEAEMNPLSSFDKFYGEAYILYGLLKEYLDRWDEILWNDAVSEIYMIHDDIQDPSTEYNNMATQYVKTSINQIRAFENTYIDTPSISAQYCHMIYKWIMNSLPLEEEKQV